MAQLGSSPLGLVMNTADNSQTKVGSYVLGDSENGKQLFNSIFGRNGEEVSTNQFDYSRDDSSLFDIKTQDVIEYCQRYPLMRLTYADFAYLKNLGVYPNNRLVIARRFAAPIGDDLINNLENNTFPLATLVSWVPDNEDFFDVNFGENWTEGDTSFKTLLDEASQNGDLLGGDNTGKKLGTFLAEGAGAIPLPGWTEGLQYELFKALGLTNLKSSDLPTGNANLIRSSKMRRVADKDGQFEGVKSSFSVKMKIEYEQKFISGIDPTGVYYDIIANALSFGTSVSKFMFKPEALGANNQFAVFLNNLGSGNTTRVGEALSAFATAISEALKNVATKIKDKIVGLWQGKEADEKKKAEETENKGVLGTIKSFLKGTGNVVSEVTSLVVDSLSRLITNIVAGVISKYKVRVIAILDSLTGSPSTPWHVTIGNPKRPILSSGDMFVDKVDVKFGKLLAYNDLPSSITLEVTLTNARALGAQEIFQKLNCGRERSYKVIRKDILSVDGELNIAVPDQKKISEELQQRLNASSNDGAGQGAPIDNSSNANQNKPGVSNGSVECFKNHNYIIDQIVSVLALKDRYGDEEGNKVPLLKKWKKFFGDNEVGAENSVRVLLIQRALAAEVAAASQCPAVKTLLLANLEKVYAGIKRRAIVMLDYYDPSSIGSASGSANLIKKMILCDF
jgi:hypothetical protein